MNDILITSKQLKRELYTLLACFLIAFACNIGAIIYYQSPATELYSSLHYVVLFSLFLYVIWAILRLVAGLIGRLLRR